MTRRQQGLSAVAVLTTLAFVCPGCGMQEAVQQSQEKIRVAHTQMQQARETFHEPQNGRHLQVIGKPWIAGRAVSLSTEVTLPQALQAHVKTTMIFKERHASLSQVAARISLASSIPVRVLPDALLPSHHFMPRLQGVGTVNVVEESQYKPMPSGTFALAKVLDVIAAQHDVQWRYGARGIEFYRTQTRVFDVRALTLAASGDMKLGRGSEGKDGFQSSAQTTLSLEREPLLTAIKYRLEPFLTRAGVVSAQPGSLTSIVVTDTPAALEGIAAYIESVNRSVSLRVRLVFEEMTVTQKHEQEQGFDWSLAFSKGLLSAGLATNRYGADGSVMQLGAASRMGSASLTVKALSEQANVLRHTVLPVVTLNRRPVTHAVRSTFTYVDQIQALATSSSKDGGVVQQPGVAVSQKQETTGAFLTLVPDVQDDGQILLSVAYDNTVAMPLKPLHFGNSSNSFQVQQLTIHGSGTVQQVALKPGFPALIAGFDERQSHNDGSRLTPNLPVAMGGFDKVSEQQRMTLIFVTAQLEEGL